MHGKLETTHTTEASYEDKECHCGSRLPVGNRDGREDRVYHNDENDAKTATNGNLKDDRLGHTAVRAQSFQETRSDDSKKEREEETRKLEADAR